MTEPTGAERAKLLARLRALRAMTVENGCSEEEAMVAAQRADELMQKLGVDATEEDVKGDRYGARKRPLNGNIQRKSEHEVRWVCESIARFCDCRVWRGTGGAIVELIYFGTAEDTDTAHWLSDVIRAAMEQEFQGYLGSSMRNPHINGRSLRWDFMLGMAKRLCERLDAMTAARKAEIERSTQGTSRALVPVTKVRTVLEKYGEYCRKNNIQIGRGRASRGGGRSQGAYEAGRAAGDRVGFGRPVSGGGAGPFQIGKG